MGYVAILSLNKLVKAIARTVLVFIDITIL